MDSINQHSLHAEKTHAGLRLDAVLASVVPEISRSRWKSLIQTGLVLLNGEISKPNHKVKEEDLVTWTLPEEPLTEAKPEAIPFEILYEDEALLVLCKPPGLVVHPAAGNAAGTLLNGLLHHDPVFQQIERAGIVHRLDKDTSGVMVVAKTETAITELQRQFKARETEKEYLAVVWGSPPDHGRIETLIGRHPRHRQKQAVLNEEGRVAISNFKVREIFAEAALMEIRIETGRTHQIRVHMTHIGHPIIGDPVYGRARKSRIKDLPKRQMLHAARLEFTHPDTGKRLSFEAPLFEDMIRFVEQQREG